MLFRSFVVLSESGRVLLPKTVFGHAMTEVLSPSLKDALF
ncbi:hypothetical protein BLA6993_07920 [Burkholderia lata]|nr:hypothetical protein BLA6993_07920 [Burkholderia lata]